MLPGVDERGARNARVILHDGEELPLERAGDLGKGNAGMLIFVGGRQHPEYVPWTEVERVDFEYLAETLANVGAVRIRVFVPPLFVDHGHFRVDREFQLRGRYQIGQVEMGKAGTGGGQRPQSCCK